MRVAQKFADDLNLLVELLNWKGKRPSKTSGLYDLIEDFDLGKPEITGVTKEKLAEAQQLKDEIIKDLSLVISGKGGRPWRDLDYLVDKINGLGLQPKWRIDFGNRRVREHQFQMTRGALRPVAGTGREVTNPAVHHLGPDQRILLLRGTKWIIRRWYPETAPVRHRLYWAIISALENGELARLRTCPTCKTYFLAADLKRRFCSQRCKDELFNLAKAKTGYFKENRKKKKKERLNTALTRLDKGESEEFVMEELGLTRKSLERALRSRGKL